MEKLPKLLSGGTFSDDRGTLSFVNSFTFAHVKRFYLIEHADTSVVRAWQGHQMENKWFYVVSGAFKVLTAKIDNWESPARDLTIKEFVLSENTSQILHIPGGYVNGFQALELNSKMMVFSNFSTEESKADDYRFDKGLWYKW